MSEMANNDLDKYAKALDESVVMCTHITLPDYHLAQSCNIIR